VKVADSRTAPFIWVSVATLRHLRRFWRSDEARAGVGLDVYVGLCEIANEGRARTSIGQNGDAFSATHAAIAERACCSTKAVARALRELERLGLVAVEQTVAPGASRPGSASTYLILEPETTSDTESKVVDGTSDSQSDGVGQPVQGGGTADPALYEEPRKEGEEDTHRARGDHEGVPKAVATALQRVALEKDSKDLDLDAIARLIAAHPDLDHADQALKFCDWYLWGKGINTTMADVPLAYKRWLKTAPPADPPRRAEPAAREPRFHGPIRHSEEAETYWAAAQPLLERSVGTSYELWIEPLRAVGERAGAIVLLDQGQGSWVERRYLGLIREALKAVDSPLLEVQVCDQFEIDAAGGLPEEALVGQ
jgi:hypothetical protein